MKRSPTPSYSALSAGYELIVIAQIILGLLLISPLLLVLTYLGCVPAHSVWFGAASQGLAGVLVSFLLFRAAGGGSDPLASMEKPWLVLSLATPLWSSLPLVFYHAPGHLVGSWDVYLSLSFLFHLAQVFALWLIPASKLSREQVLDELVDAACLGSIIIALLWGWLDLLVDHRPLQLDQRPGLLLMFRFGGAILLMFICFCLLLRRDSEALSSFRRLLLFLVCILAQAADILYLQASVSKSECAYLLHACVAGLILAALGGIALAAFPFSKAPLLRFSTWLMAIPRSAVILWFSHACVLAAVVLLLLGQAGLLRNRNTHSYILVGFLLAALLAIRQGRSLMKLKRLASELDTGNRRLAQANLLMSELSDIGEREAEQRIEAMNGRVNQLFEKAPWGVYFFHVTQGYETMNPVMEELLGFKRQEFSPARMREVLGERSWELHERQLRRSIESRQPVEFELAFHPVLGDVLTIILFLPILDQQQQVFRVAAFVRDITRERQAQMTLQETEEKFEKAFQSSPDAIIICVEHDGRIIEANRSALQDMGITDIRRVIGRTALELGLWVDIRDRQRYLEELRRQGNVRDLEVRGRAADGSLQYRHISVDRVEVSGVPCIIAVVKNVTAQKIADQERKVAEQRERSLRQEYTGRLILSQEAERRRIAGGLHDGIGQDLLLLRNRLSMVLQQEHLPAALRSELQELCELSLHAVGEIRRVAYDLLPYQLDHLGLTRALRAMVENAAKGGGCTLSHKLDNVDELFDVDQATGLFRIVQECLNNVIKHSRAAHASVRIERDIHEVELTVEDDGQGFTTSVRGSGLGLSNIAERARLLGGDLTVESNPGQGTRLTLRIKINPEL